MQALETIERQNNEAVQRDIPAQQAAGKHVIAEYAGLNFTGYQAFDTEKDALAHASAYQNQTPGNRVEYFAPTNK